MSNIAQNLIRTAKLARRIANSKSPWNLDWSSMMKEIYGSRSEEFGVDMLQDAAGTAGGGGESAIGLGGMGICGWIAIIVALLFLLSLLLVYLSPLFVNVPPPAAPHWADAVRSAPSEESLRELPKLQDGSGTNSDGSQLSPTQQLNKEIIERGGTYPGMRRKVDRLDEAALQRQRMEAIMSGNTDRYNQLIEQHKKLYKQNGIDPCKSGFFPQGCQ